MLGRTAEKAAIDPTYYESAIAEFDSIGWECIRSLSVEDGNVEFTIRYVRQYTGLSILPPQPIYKWQTRFSDIKPIWALTTLFLEIKTADYGHPD